MHERDVGTAIECLITFNVRIFVKISMKKFQKFRGEISQWIFSIRRIRSSKKFLCFRGRVQNLTMNKIIILKVANVFLHLLAAVHLSFATYKMSTATIPSHIYPIDEKFSGKWKYLTFWNVVSTLIPHLTRKKFLIFGGLTTKRDYFWQYFK